MSKTIHITFSVPLWILHIDVNNMIVDYLLDDRHCDSK